MFGVIYRLGHKMGIVIICVSMSAAIINCSRPNEPKAAMVLDYYDFGPQAMSYKVLGYSWWQWQSQGDSDPRLRDDIQVVVYRRLSLDEVKRGRI